jgi:hypothetical protein
MSVQDDNSQYVPKPSAYGRIFREKGTKRLFIAAVAVFVLYRSYGWFNDYRLNQVKWPPLQPSKQGLVVLGLRDKEKTGHFPKFKAYETNRSWQIRYNEDADPNEGNSQESESQDETSRRPDGASGAGRRGGNRGSVVPLDELLKECPTFLNGTHFTSASIEEKYESILEKSYYIVHLTLSDEGRSRYWQFASNHEDERAVFLLEGEVLTCPRMANMFVSSLSIEQFWVKADAEKLANFINKRKT